MDWRERNYYLFRTPYFTDKEVLISAPLCDFGKFKLPH